MAAGDPSRPWEYAGMSVSGGRLLVVGRDAEALALEHGTPLHVYGLQCVAEVTRALQDALGWAGLRHRVRLALKALRASAALHVLRRLGPPGDPAAIGLDACSPGEVLHGLECGFLPQEITYTGTNISERDLEEAVARAARHGLTIDTAHFHLANGMLDDELPVFDQALGEGARLVRRLVDASCPLREVNVGGGLGMPLHEGERPMDLDAYAGNINEGDYLSGEDVAFPEVAEGDIVAMVGIGGYCQSMWTDHCGRPRAGALFFEERA